MNTKLVVPPMPKAVFDKNGMRSIGAIGMHEEALEAWGQDCAAIAQREAALADEMAEGLQELADDTDPTGPMADAAVHAAVFAILSKHKEARNEA